MTNEEYAKTVLSHASPGEPFHPQVSFDPDGDCIEFVAKPDDYYAERVDSLVTVYYSRESSEIVGSLIKGVSRFRRDIADRLPGFVIEIKDGPIKLEHIFLAKMWTSGDQVARITYSKLAKLAEEAHAVADVCAM